MLNSNGLGQVHQVVQMPRGLRFRLDLGTGAPLGALPGASGADTMLLLPTRHV